MNENELMDKTGEFQIEISLSRDFCKNTYPEFSAHTVNIRRLTLMFTGLNYKNTKRNQKCFNQNITEQTVKDFSNSKEVKEDIPVMFPLGSKDYEVIFNKKESWMFGACDERFDRNDTVSIGLIMNVFNLDYMAQIDGSRTKVIGIVSDEYIKK